MKQFEGENQPDGLKIGIVASRYNELILTRLLSGALEALKEAGVAGEDVTLVRVAGAFEVPLAAQQLVRSGKYHAVVCLAAIIRGETPHFEYLAAEVSRGIGEVGLQSGIPVTFGVLTTDSIDQAVARTGAKPGNKGYEAAMSAIQLAGVMHELEQDN